MKWKLCVHFDDNFFLCQHTILYYIQNKYILIKCFSLGECERKSKISVPHSLMLSSIFISDHRMDNGALWRLKCGEIGLRVNGWKSAFPHLLTHSMQFRKVTQNVTRKAPFWACTLSTLRWKQKFAIIQCNSQFWRWIKRIYGNSLEFNLKFKFQSTTIRKTELKLGLNHRYSLMWF